ncbi:sulfate permease [Ruficoccus amylovorans]|uniref:Sulfate permease n=1 Tax=Ruficoccus amylovorans TaxID=1804625 RepID=A0A842HDT1_9BACT|nr:sulfate permease [Ruficoccus amylovorans]MBC2594198.1 sulfate permease [Ruficoccus amylovorans]
MRFPTFRPRLVECLHGYNFGQFRTDLIAGITVGIVALPLAMAFAIASGVPPQAGIFTAVIAGFIISAFGGSRVQIGGPTGAFIVIVYGILTEYGAANLALCTIMAGVILLIMGFAGLGQAIKFIPYPVTVGFTSGIAVLILSTQIKDFLGLDLASVPSGFLDKCAALGGAIGTTHLPTAILATASLLLIIFWPKAWTRIVPGSVVALVLGTVAVALFELPVETIGSRFGGIPEGLPPLQVPEFSFSGLTALIQPATTIALLAAIESLLSAVVADGMIDDRHDSNQELKAQGLANIICPLFGGIAATGAIARTATNVRSGGRTPIAGMTHAVTLLLILLVAAPLAKSVPLATLGAVLVMVAYNMGEWHQFKRLLKWPRSDAAVFLTTFALTVLFDLTLAVEVGMVLAAMLFIKRVADTSQITPVSPETDTEGVQHSLQGKDVPDEVQVFRILGPFFFGVADRLETALKRAQREPQVVILRMRKVTAMDATGLNALENLYEKLTQKHRHLVISALQPQPYRAIKKGGLLDRLGPENVCPDIDAALARAKAILSQK